MIILIGLLQCTGFDSRIFSFIRYNSIWLTEPLPSRKRQALDALEGSMRVRVHGVCIWNIHCSPIKRLDGQKIYDLYYWEEARASRAAGKAKSTVSTAACSR